MIRFPSTFFTQAKEAANFAKSCRQDESSQNAFLDALIRLENLTSSFAPSETSLIQTYNQKCKLACDRLLELAIKRLNQACRGDIDQICRNLQIHAIQANHEILPSGAGAIEASSGSEVHPFTEAKPCDKFAILVRTLLESGISSDDLMVLKGKDPDGSIRKSPYYLIEVPRKDLQFMICQETNQASFIIRGMIPRDDLFSLDKESLIAKYPNEITRLIWRGDEDYRQAIINSLESETMPKINIQDRETFVELIKKTYTSAEWVNLTSKTARLINFDNRSLSFIARKVFGMRSFNYTNTDDRLKLGALIYGSSESTIKQAQEDRVGLKKLIKDRNYAVDFLKDKFKNLKTWLNLSIQVRRAIKFHGAGIKIIGKIILGREFEPENPKEWRLLGEEIFGKDAEQELSHGQKIQLLQSGGLEYIRTSIKNQYPDSQSLMNAPIRQSKNINIDGVAITAIAKILGIQDFKHSSRLHLILFGFAIFGNDDILLREYHKVYSALNDKERLKSLLKERIPLKEWSEMTKKEILSYRLADVSLLTIFNILFDISKTKPQLTQDQWRQMCELVHGEGKFDDQKALLKKGTFEQYKSNILHKFPNVNDLLSLPLRAIKSGSVKLVEGEAGNDSVIACFIENYEGPPNKQHLIDLAKQLYPDCNDFITKVEAEYKYQQKLKEERDFLVDELKRLVGNDKGSWTGYTFKQKQEFRIGGLGINAVHTLLGFKSGPEVNQMWENIINSLFGED